MKIRFEEKQDIPENDPCVVIQAKQLSDQAREVMEYLEQFSTVNQVVIPIKTDDHLIMVKIDDIILAEIDKNQLTIYTIDKTFTIRDTLINFQHRINRRNFLQISRHAVMNIDHLESLSDSFSGNMMAKLTRGVKSSVSRKYVRNILAIFLMSGTMGVLTFILEEEEFLTYSLRVALHLVVTAAILALTYLFFGWGTALRSPIPWLIFLAIYGLIWLYQIWQLHKKTQRINQALLHRRKGK